MMLEFEAAEFQNIQSDAGMNVGTHPMELIPMDKLRYQLEVNLIAPVLVSQVLY